MIRTAPEDGCSEDGCVSAVGAASLSAGGASSSFSTEGSGELGSASRTEGAGGESGLSAVGEKKATRLDSE